MPELRWFEAFPPGTTALSDVTALLRVLAGRPFHGLRHLQPIVVFELWLHPDRVRWLVGVELSLARTLPGQFVAQLPGLVLIPVDESERVEPITARELRLSSLTYPLRTDTAAGVTAGLLAARRELRSHEALCVQWVVGPSHVCNQLPVTRTPLDLLGFTTPHEPDSGERQAWKQKQAESLYGVRGRIGAVASEPRWAGALLRPVVAALSLANGTHARLRASQQSSRTAAQLMEVMGRARTWSGVLNAAELAALLGWCISGEEIPGLPGRLAPPPKCLLAAATSDVAAERIAGISSHPATRGQVVRLPLPSYAANFHVVGPTGSGKSTSLAAWALSEAMADRSLIVIEPKGDLVTDVLARLPQHRHADVVVLDPGIRGTHSVTGFNPLRGPRDDAERRADSLLGLFKELFGTAIGPRSSDVLLHGLIAVSRLDDGALTDVMPFLTIPQFRRWVLAGVSDPLTLAPWAAWFDQLSEGERAQVVAPIGNKLRVFTARPSVRRLLGQSAPKFDLADIFERPLILLVNLNVGAIGPETAKTIGSLLLSQLWEEIQRQTIKPAHKRRMVPIIVDEWQEFTAGLDFADVLARARGANAPFTLAHQHLDQLSSNLKAAVLANARSRLVYRPAEGDAKTLAAALGSPVTPSDLDRLPAYHAVTRVLLDGAPSTAFEVATLPLPKATTNPVHLRHASAESYGVDPAQLDEALVARWQGRDQTPSAPIGMRRKRS